MLKAFLQKPTFNELLFAFKCLLAATLALFIALRMGLPRPFWAPMATCILSQAMTGSVYVRGISRLVGTIFGVIASVFLMVMFINYTFLLCFLIALWVGCCMYFSMLKRTTDAYVFTVAGFTVPVIVYSVVGDINFINIQYITDTAIARAQETGIGFISAVLMHSLFLPKNIGPVVIKRMDDVWKDIQNWIGTVLSENEKKDSSSRLSATQILTDLRLLSANLPNDASNERWAIANIQMLQDRLTVLISLVSSIEDSVFALKKAKLFSQYWEYLLENIIVWIQQNNYTPQSAQWLRERIKKGVPKISSQSSWDEIMIIHLATDLEKLITACENCSDQRRAIDECLRGNAPKNKIKAVSLHTLHKDHYLAFLISSSAVFSITLISLAWVISGWNAGFVAPMMASIFYLSFVRNENSVALMKTILLFTILSLLPAGIFLLVIMHGTHSFETLMLFFAPCIFIVGIFMARPAIGLASTIFMMGIWSTTTMYDLDMANATSFINGQVFAQCFGIIVALLSALIFRSFDAEWTTHRLLNIIRNDITKLTKPGKLPTVIQTTVKMIDRISVIAPRLSSFGDEKENIISRLFREMRIGVNMVNLMQMRSRLSRNGVDIESLLQALTSYFSTKTKEADKKESLLLVIDHTLQTVCNMPSPIRQNAAVAALTSIRCDLFPTASPYYPQSLIPKEIS